MARMLVRSLFAAAVFLFATTVLVAQNDDPPTGGGAQTDCVGEGCGGGGADEMAPVIDLMTPSNGATVSAASPFIQIEYCDNVSIKSSTRSITLNGSSVTSSFTHSSVTPLGDCGARKKDESSSLVLTPGTNYLSASICDLVGNCNTGNWTIVYSVQAPPVVTLKNFNADNQDRGMCLTLGAGQAAGLSCGDLFVTHSMPTYRTMGRDRALTLFYSSAAATPRPVVAAVVTQPAGTATPTSVFAQLTVAGTVRASATYSAFGPADGARQIALSFDAAAAGLATGVYPFTLLVRNNYAGGPQDTSYTGELLINSLAGSEFGSGWSVLGVEGISCLSGCSRMLWTGGDGSIALYNRVGSLDRWARASGAYQDTIAWDGTYYTRSLRHGVQVKFNTSGIHVQTINRAGQATVFYWSSWAGSSGHARLVTVTVPSVSGTAQTYAFAYEGSSAVLDYIQDPAGRRIEPYIGTSTSYGSTISYIDDADAGRTSFEYDAGGRMTRRVGRSTFGTRYDYANNLHVSRVRIPLNPTAGDTSSTTMQWWDEQGLAMGVVGSTLTAPDTAAAYTRVFGPRDSVADDATFRVDRWGAPVHIVGAVNDTTVVQRSSTTGLVSRLETPGHQVWSMTYNGRGNLLTQTDSTHEGAGSVAPVTNSYVYGDASNPDSPTEIRSPVDTTVTTYHSTFGVPTLVRRQGGGRTGFTYDATTALLASVTDYGARTVDTTWARGFANLTTTLVYDSLGNDTLTAAPSGKTTRMHRDTWGRVASVYDPAGHRTDHVYDVLNRQTGVLVWGATVDSTLYSYSANGLIESIVDPRRVRQRWYYNAADQDSAMEDASRHQERHQFNRGGLVDSVRTRDGNWIVRTYNAAGQVLTARSPSVSYTYFGAAMQNYATVPGDTVRYHYDRAGRLDTIVQARDTVVNVYNREGTLKTQRQIVRDAAGTLQSDLAVSYLYDAGDRRTRMVHSGDTITYAYGPDALLQTMAVKWGAAGVASDTFRFMWDSLGRRDSLIYVRPGVSVSYGYDLDGSLRMVCSRNPGNSRESDFLEHQLRYDSANADGLFGRMVRYAGVNAGSGSQCTGAFALIEYASNTFDTLHQVTRDNNYHYQYDRSGNRLSRRWNTGGGLADSLTYSDSTNLLFSRLVDYSGTAVVRRHYQYDASGSLGQEQPVAGCDTHEAGCDAIARLFYHNAVGQLRGVRSHLDDGAGSGTWTGNPLGCHYDPLGRRVISCGMGTALAFDGPNVIRNVSGSFLWWRYVHGPGVDDPLVGLHQPSTGAFEKYYYLTDGRGRLLAFTDDDGDTSVTSKNRYSDNGGSEAGAVSSGGGFENSRSSTPSAPGLSYYRNRYYDQQTGRWTQEDPLGPAGGINLYGFVGNNPATLSDPFGLCPPQDNHWTPECDKPLEGPGLVDPVAILAGGVASGIRALGARLLGTLAADATGATAVDAIATSQGLAAQEGSAAARALRTEVQNGAQVFRGGTLGKSAAAEGQFWAAESPLNPGYASRLGAASFQGQPQFVIGGTLRQGASVITRTAPPFGGNAGGALEAVTNPGAIRIDFFHMP